MQREETANWLECRSPNPNRIDGVLESNFSRFSRTNWGFFSYLSPDDLIGILHLKPLVMNPLYRILLFCGSVALLGPSCQPSAKPSSVDEMTAFSKQAPLLERLSSNSPALPPDSIARFAQRLVGLGWGEWSQDSLLAAAADRVGGQLLGQGNFTLARQCFEQALTLRRGHWPQLNHKDILRMFHNIGITHARQGDPHQAITYFDSAGLAAAEYFPLLQFLNPLRQAQEYQALGEYHEAHWFFQEAAQHQKRANGSQLSEFWRSWGSNYRRQRQYAAGLKLLNEVIATLDGSDVPASNAGDLYMVLANLWQDSLYQLPRATVSFTVALQASLQAFDQAEKIYAQIADVALRQSRLTLAIANRGELLRRVGQPKAAVALLSAALEAKDTTLGAAAPYQSILHLNRGESLLDQRAYSLALADFSAALTRIAPNFQPTPQQPLPSLLHRGLQRNDYVVALTNLAQAHLGHWQTSGGQQIKSLENAAQAYDTLFKLINVIRADFTGDEEKMALAEQIQPVLRRALWCTQQLAHHLPRRRNHYHQAAFQISEQSRAFALLEAARLRNLTSRLDLRQRQRELELLATKVELETELNGLPAGDPAVPDLRRQLARHTEEIRRFQQELKTQLPQYYALKYRGADLPISALQREILAPDQALVAYSWLDSALVAFVVTPQTFQLHTWKVREDSMAQWVEQYVSGMAGPAAPHDLRSFAALGQKLYQHLLAPLEPLLPSRVVIIPAGPLYNLPFETLLRPTTADDFAGLVQQRAYALFRHHFSYCFSANLLQAMQQQKPKRGLRPLPAVLAADFSQFDRLKASQDPRLDPFMRQAVAQLTSLAEPQRQELAGMAQAIPAAKRYFNRHATKAAFLKACQEHTSVHLATHGIMNPANSEASFLVSTQRGGTFDAKELLGVKDLYSLHLPLEFIFLSACQTGAGAIRAGEGNLSLGRGLAYAGVKSLITSWWSVNAAAKARLAADFYAGYLNQGLSKDVALGRAKQLLASAYPNPSHWAGFLLQGDCRAPTSRKWAWWLLLGLVPFGVLMMRGRGRSKPV